jgi:hypothetical protein
METAAAAVQSSFKSYIDRVRSVWGDGKDPELPLKVKAFLEGLLRTASSEEPWMARLIAEGRQSNELYRDPVHGFIQMGHNQPLGHGNRPHDHGPCWVLYGVYRGYMEITTYRRTDDGKIAGRATLEKQGLQKLSPGVVIPYFPGDIHSTSAKEPSVVFRFLSYDLNKVERYRYDTEKGTVSLAQ